jgi:3-hydroxyacyl-CoA dehydrogenase
VGSKQILDQITEWHERYGERWKPSTLLREIAASGGSLREAMSAQ